MMREVDYLDRQLTLFEKCEIQQTESSQSFSSGKTSQEHFRQINGMNFKLCLKKSQRPKFQYLQADDGQSREWSEAENVMLLGGCLMPNIGECPSVENVSSLLQIIEKNNTEIQRYYLSPKACQGILRRAKMSGKELPPELKTTLERQAVLSQV